MQKINIDGLLKLNLEEIEIVYRRCRGESVRKAALEMGKVESTFWNVRIPKIVKALDVEKWGDIEEELCKPLMEIIPSLQALRGGWPERFREELEALRDPLQFAGTTEPLPPPSQTDHIPPSTLPPPAASLPVSGSTNTGQSRRPFAWPVIAIPLLIFCLLCISGILFGRRFLVALQGNNATATLTLAPQVPLDTETSLPINTPSLVASETSLPTSTNTAAPPTLTSTPTNTPLPTDSPTSSVPALFFDDFNNGKSSEWQLISGDEPVIVNGSLTFEGTTTIIIIDQEWTDYELSFYVSNMQCQEHVGSRGLTVGLRVQDANNMVALRINDQDYCGGTWGRIQNSVFDAVPNSNFKLPPVDSNGGRQITIRAQGNTFSTPIGTSVVLENYPTGGIAFISAEGVIVDNVRVTSLTP